MTEMIKECKVCSPNLTCKLAHATCPYRDVDTINGLPRVLVNKVREILKQFWNKQPYWGDAAVESWHAEKIIHAVREWGLENASHMLRERK